MSLSSGPRAAPGAHTQVTCSKCGAATTVPFTPTPGRPVYCRACFATRPAPHAPSGGFRGGPRGAGSYRSDARPAPVPNQRQRMLAQGRKGHFMHDARAVLDRTEGGMEDQHIRAFLEGLFARGARTNVDAAQEFLNEKVADDTITPQQREGLGRLLERYSFWR